MAPIDLAALDLDGTILRSDTVCEAIARELDQYERMYELERAAMNVEIRQSLEGRALYTPDYNATADGYIVFQCMAMHESGHNLGAEHHHGGYEILDPEARDVSPMATSYVRCCPSAVGTYEYDTCIGGSDEPPDDFQCGPVNNSGRVDRFCAACDSPCRHTTTLTGCTMSKIDNYVPL